MRILSNQEFRTFAGSPSEMFSGKVLHVARSKKEVAIHIVSPCGSTSTVILSPIQANLLSSDILRYYFGNAVIREDDLFHVSYTTQCIFDCADAAIGIAISFESLFSKTSVEFDAPISTLLALAHFIEYREV